MRCIKFLSLVSSASYITPGCVLCYTLRTQAADFLHPSSEKQRTRLLIFPERFNPDKPTTNWPRLIMTENRFFRGAASACLQPGDGRELGSRQAAFMKIGSLSNRWFFTSVYVYSSYPVGELCYFVSTLRAAWNLGYLGGSTTLRDWSSRFRDSEVSNCRRNMPGDTAGIKLPRRKVNFSPRHEYKIGETSFEKKGEIKENCVEGFWESQEFGNSFSVVTNLANFWIDS